jgi:acyl-CoA thioester hydrolase
MLTQTEINYRQQLTLQDRPIGKMWIVELGHVRCLLAAKICGGNSIIATAKQTIVFVDLTTRRPVKIPAALRAKV